ncbi:MAG: hypothetical protein AD073_000018 [Mycoplasmataceae bacterium]|nr:MAG: hypothetical protein AD073_000018 [Mycoplasmataceae bacterium]
MNGLVEIYQKEEISKMRKLNLSNNIVEQLDFNSVGMQQITLDLIDNKSHCNQKLKI